MGNREIFRKAVSALEVGTNVGLVTVVATVGSTPGKVGYKMLVTRCVGDTVGTIGGGFVEARIIVMIRNMLTAGVTGRVVRIDLGNTPRQEEGICGGSVEMLVETLDAGSLPLFRALSVAAEHDEEGLLVSVTSGDMLPQKAYVANGGELVASIGGRLTPALVAAMLETVKGGDSMQVSCGAIEAFVERLSVPPRVVIFGAGHLACHLCMYAKSLGFRVTIYDDRSDYANRQRFADADEVIVGDFANALDTACVDADSYVVVVTRGHAWDEMVLEQVVRANVRYIGMIGSRRKTATILANLRYRGIPDHLLNRVYSPIGLAIGAITPEEIALSIASELVKIRRLGPEAPVVHMASFRMCGDAGSKP